MTRWCKLCGYRDANELTDFCGDNCEDRYNCGERTVAHLEKAVREEREAVVMHLRARSLWFREMWKSPAGLHSDENVADHYADEAEAIERGEHRR